MTDDLSAEAKPVKKRRTRTIKTYADLAEVIGDENAKRLQEGLESPEAKQAVRDGVDALNRLLVAIGFTPDILVLMGMSQKMAEHCMETIRSLGQDAT